jgi:large subunit ribosomal protein L5
MRKSPQELHYLEVVKEQLQKKFNYENPMMIPRLSKIVVSMGLAEASKDKQLIENCITDLKLITGQKPLPTKSSKAISNFKLREGQLIGAKVTLRGHRMYDFMYRLIHICMPRIPDFRGLKKKADGRGSYSVGIKDQMIFPEIDLDKVKFNQGMNFTFVTSAKTDEECMELLSLMGMPLKGSSTR